MKKLSLILLLVIIADLSIFAQYNDTDPWKPNKSILLDKTTIEAVYSVKLTDKDFEQPRQYYSILEVGKNFTKFSDYYRWRCDSVLSGMDTLKLTNGDVNKINNSNYYSFGKSDYIINDLKHNKTS